MKRTLRVILLAVALIGATLSVDAAIYYLRDCGVGAEGTCTAGSDSAAGTSDATAWQSCSKVTSTITSAASAPAGTQFLFAKGAAWDSCSISPTGSISGSGDNSANPIIIGSYSPATGGTVVPKLTSATGTVFNFVDSGNADRDAGLTIQDLHLIGSATNNTKGIGFGNDIDYLTLQRLEIELFDLGIQAASAQTNALNSNTDGIISHVILRDSYIHNNYTQGWLGLADDILMENNRFSNNGGKTTTSDHQVYFDGSTLLGVARTAKQVVVRGNTFTDNNSYRTSDGLFTAGRCASVAITSHGHVQSMVFSDNIVKETTPSTTSGCLGVAFDAGYNITSSGAKDAEGFTFVAVDGNHVINYPVSIGLDICQWCRISNNWIYSDAAASQNPDGIRMRSKYYEFGVVDGSISSERDLYPRNVEVVNNSVWLAHAGATSVGIRWSHHVDEAASLWGVLGANHVNANNLIVLAGASITTTTQCFNVDNISSTRFAEFDGNLCYSTSANTPKWVGTSSLATWQGASGWDSHSLFGNNTAGSGNDPLITVPSSPAFSLAIPTGSPAKNAAITARCPALSIFGRVRSTADATCDIGADEYNAASDAAPQAPTRIGVQ